MTLKTVTVDGIPIEVTDQGATVIATLQSRLTDAATAQTKLVADHATAIAAKDKELAGKDAEIDGLKAKVVDGVALDKLVADRAEIVGKAKKVAPTLDCAGKSNADIRRAAVAAKLGDAAVKDKSDDYVEARFDGLLADASGADPFRQVVQGGIQSDNATLDGNTAYAQMIARDAQAWQDKKETA